MVSERATRPNVLFLHVGWARDYHGAPDDVPQGKFGYLKDTDDTPGETFNFRDYDGRRYGYAPSIALNLSRLGAQEGADAHGITVVWMATNPDGSGRYIVGWYRNARVYPEGRHERPEEGCSYVVTEAATEDCRLLQIDERTFSVPFMRPGYPGVSSAFYASERLRPEELEEVLVYVGGEPSVGLCPGRATSSRQGGSAGRGAVDPEDRKAVEKAAIAVVAAHYEALGWVAVSVEAENRGWDLVVTRGARLLLVEVKGRADRGPVELTANEYRAMQDPKNRMAYRLAVVFDALTAPVLTIFQYAPGREAWLSEDGEALGLTETTSATARLRGGAAER